MYTQTCTHTHAHTHTHTCNYACTHTHLALNELAHYLVVEVVDGSPFNPLLHILLLLSLQSQLNEDLLQLLIHKVDAELLKPVFLHGKCSNSTAVYIYVCDELNIP